MIAFKRKGLISLIIVCFICVMAFGFVQFANPTTVVQAASGSWKTENLTVKGGSVDLTGVTANPVNYADEAASGLLVTVGESLDEKLMKGESPLIFTASYPFTTTKRVGNYTEYAVKYDETKEYKVVSINENGDGKTYIPVGGFVISVANSSNWSAQVGAVIKIEGKLTIHDKAVESDSGARVAIDSINGVRSQPMVVYYDYESGSKTGTNVYGSELLAVFDENSGKFKVQSFRMFGEGDASGSIIPENGFVLSGYGDGYRGIFHGETRFKTTDYLTMVGFDYIRFGGEPVTYQYDYDYYDMNDANDECNKNPGRFETANNPFPAFRGDSQTIIYHDGWSYNGASGTGTNVYGFEAAVDANGVVVERGVNVSKIPEGGFVISGHDEGRDFIRSNVSLGATVTLDKNTKTYAIRTSLNSFYVNVKSTVETIINSAKAKIEQLYDLNYNALNEKITQTENLMTELEQTKVSIEQKSEDPNWDALEKVRELMKYNSAKLEAEKTAYEILALCQESKPVSARATWHRPTEKSLAVLTQTLDMYKDVGINLIFVESFYNGYSLFKSQYVDYHPDFATANYGDYADYLSAFTALANERGIEVHAWVENFYVGLSNSIRILTEHPDWIMYNDDGTYYQRNEGGAYIFIDPTNDEVKDSLITYYKELLDKNPLIKGLNLDYIRYPVSNDQADTGFTKNSMIEFAKTINLTKINESMDVSKMIKEFTKWAFNKAYNVNAEETYNKWCEFRRNHVSAYVERIAIEIKEAKGVKLSTAVFSSLNESKNSKKQDWQSWIRNGWIDMATPMAYFDSSTDVLKGVSDMMLLAGPNCYYYAGLASSFRGLPAYENVNQIEASYLGGANGYVIFCSTQIVGHEDVQEVLKAGFNSRTAVLPHAQAKEVVTAVFDRITERVDSIYMPANGMTEKNKTALLDKFAEILAMEYETANQLEQVRLAIASMCKTTNLSKYAKGYSQRRIQENLTELAELLETKIAILGGVDEPEIPTESVESESKVESTKPVESSTGKKKGCKSSVGSLTALLPLCFVAFVIKKQSK